MGSDDWTTLPEAGGLTSTDVPAECEAGLPARGAPVPRALPDAAATPARATGTTGRVERDDRQLRTAGSRSTSTCPRTPGSRSRCRSATSPTRRPAGSASSSTTPRCVVGGAVTAERGLRDRARRLVAARSAGRQPAGRRRLRAVAGPAVGGRHHRGLGAARLRHRAGRDAGRAGRARPAGDAAPAELTGVRP